VPSGIAAKVLRVVGRRWRLFRNAGGGGGGGGSGEFFSWIRFLWVLQSALMNSRRIIYNDVE